MSDTEREQKLLELLEFMRTEARATVMQANTLETIKADIADIKNQLSPTQGDGIRQKVERHDTYVKLIVGTMGLVLPALVTLVLKVFFGG